MESEMVVNKHPPQIIVEVSYATPAKQVIYTEMLEPMQEKF